ncbi:YqaE/Pmp3 family membrane protein [Sodalis endosymbiont of Spalangia cameroni]
MDFVKVIFAIILPPVGVFMEVGLRVMPSNSLFL